MKEQAKRAVSTGETLIGAQVYWTELTAVRIDRDAFRVGVTACGLKDALAEVPKAEKLLNAAVKTANQKQHGDVQTRTKVGFAELKSKDDLDATYAVLMRRDSKHGQRGYVEEASISLDRKQPTPVPVVTHRSDAPADRNRDALVAGIVTEYTELLSFSYTQEVSETLVRAVRDVCGGVSLRSGLYLVRPSALKALTELQEFLAASCGAQVEIWEIRETPLNTQAAKRGASKSLREDIDTLIAKVRTFTASTTAEDVQLRSVNAKVREFKELDGRVQLYADVLGDYAENLRNAIRDARGEMLKTLGIEDAAAEAA